MNDSLYEDAHTILRDSVAAVLPETAVRRALAELRPGPGRVILIATGKAAWRMASAAVGILPRLDGGLVITKYGHLQGPLPGLELREAGHPVPDENGFAAARRALELVSDLTSDDTVVFLLSGGASALFELPLVDPAELTDITGQLLRSGADIANLNAVRKRLSAVKGGRFARACAPAHVFGVLLSDVLGDRPDVIGSGPTCPDTSTSAEALRAAERYHLTLSDRTLALLGQETPKSLTNAENHVTGSVRELCAAAARSAKALGYEPILLTDRLDCEAREAGRFLGNIARTHAGGGKALAFIAGGETVVHVTGSGLGGRNQELALAAAPCIAGVPGVCVFSLGSDGTDGPTDAAGGYVDGGTAPTLARLGLSVPAILQNNDAYHALEAAGGLLITGPTGTNVNDVSVALVRG